MLITSENIEIKKVTLFILLIILAFSKACISPYDLKSEAGEFLVVVDGKITQEPIRHELHLTRSNATGSGDFNPITGARITLFDETGNSENYIEEGNGLYFIEGSTFDRRSGESYFIEIELSNKRIYRSIPQVMPEAVRPDKLTAKVESQQELYNLSNTIEVFYLNLYIDTPVLKDGKEFYYIWRMDHVFSFPEISCPPPPDPQGPPPTPKTCYVWRDHKSDEIKIFSGKGINEGMLEQFKMASIRIDSTWEYANKHFYNVAQHSITKEAYKYWETVKQVSQSTGSIFDTPPGPVPGNLYNVNDPEERILGFFEVSAVDTIRTYTFAEDLEPIGIEDRCYTINYYRIPHPACCNCLILYGSKTERPGFWDYVNNDQ